MSLTSPLPTATPTQIGLHPERTQYITQVLRECIERQHIPGAVVLIARQGQIGLFDAVGQQDPSNTHPCAPTASFASTR